MKTVTRTLIYTGPENWIRMCIDRAWAKLERELGTDKRISSTWGEITEAIEKVKPKGATDGDQLTQ